MAPLLRAEPPVVVTPGTTTTTITTVEKPGMWITVPDDYDGYYFLYNDHYYHGGKYETGDFVWEGRHYRDRYMHDGKWIYGGKWEHHARKEAKREERRAERDLNR
jgi:hypothetical protein